MSNFMNTLDLFGTKYDQASRRWSAEKRGLVLERQVQALSEFIALQVILSGSEEKPPVPNNETGKPTHKELAAPPPVVEDIPAPVPKVEATLDMGLANGSTQKLANGTASVPANGSPAPTLNGSALNNSPTRVPNGSPAPALNGSPAPALNGSPAPALNGSLAPALNGSPAPALNGAVEAGPEKESTKLARKIINILERYGQHANASEDGWMGKNHFVSVVEKHIEAGEPVRMVIPAFPFKSPNRKDKALGCLPDFGEELALAHLNGLCETICEIYENGAEITIASDGLVYNDLLGVDDEDVWNYGEALRTMAVEKGFDNIKFLRIIELLDIAGSKDLSKEEYLLHAQCYRRGMVDKFGNPDFDPHKQIRTDEDTCLTYRGYIKFLTADLQHSPSIGDPKSGKKFKRAIEKVATSMIVRGKAFAKAVAAKCGDQVRLSIHSSTGNSKLSLPLIPQTSGSFLITPWHGCIAVGLDGSYNVVHSRDVRETHDLVYRNGRPYYFREKSPLYDWGDLKVDFEFQYPSGLIIRPSDGKPSLREIDMKKIRGLSELVSPVVARGFAETTDRDLYINKGHELGTVLPWTFGILQEVKDHGKTHRLHNNVVSNEAMPMHFDGMFKFLPKKDENGNVILDEEGKEVKVQTPPGFQYFTCIETAPVGSGYTLFASSRLFWKYLPAQYTVERLEKVTWAMDNDGFWDAKLTDLPLVVRHPTHNTPCLRWHEPWDSAKTKFSTCLVTIENDTQEIVQLIDQMVYDRRVCMRFSWEQGDILVSDNTAMLHTRTAFEGDSDRELWRIHFD